MRQPDLFRLPQKPWNAGRLIGPKAPLKPKHIWAIRQQLKTNADIRDLAMFNCALDAELRGCELIKLGSPQRPSAWHLKLKGLWKAIRLTIKAALMLASKAALVPV